ncbi:ATP-dependent sacrificial sulfur transferase LarE [Sporomusa acidovorans]|uniref:Pyridinium-3,5-bisthiocarboxylic acid mononucleotide synthase n=1 Tax=Sporomusa acidovorans (strain ATCC 49682 / DSM 3132 / Mol) TaxID=1123286 RepID=A0ABZ3J6Z6_SPOA4|nr:ATP-dependent sacrificial sulfur transferase LarE [Sporomusa acidovorans]OZC18493.1 tRNA(Ile)-lysidine synthase [Sporomusa acidovorans DSM 3132]SDE36523.1 uncharacterized protein SAMN04488499_101229 [Sporomusa acidovorans]
MPIVQEKINKLNELLLSMGSVVISFSGGVDSTFLAAAAHKLLSNKAVAVTAYSESFAAWEKNDAQAIAKAIGIKHIFLPGGEMNNADFVSNTYQRCYYCKKERFSALAVWAKEHGYGFVAEGSNNDDLEDFRPGMKAIAELPVVRSPLLEAGFTKEEIRLVSRQWGLPTWDKPSTACLVSRLTYGLPITAQRLLQIEQAEKLVRSYCSGKIRVRHHGALARIEVQPEVIPLLTRIEVLTDLVAGIKELGFTYVTIDLSGYRTGSMNEMMNEV